MYLAWRSHCRCRDFAQKCEKNNCRDYGESMWILACGCLTVRLHVRSRPYTRTCACSFARSLCVCVCVYVCACVYARECVHRVAVDFSSRSKS
jgi:hypothetical protein